MSIQWDALVAGDYEYVMPLTYNKKYGIHYLFQPAFTACLGVFGNSIDAGILESFLRSIPAKFRYWDIYLNPGNLLPVNGFSLYERMNYVLPLNGSYETIFNGFRDNIKRNIKRAEQSGTEVSRDIDIEEVILLSREQSASFSPYTEADYEHFAALYHELKKDKRAITYGIRSSGNKLLASAAFLFSNNRAYYILVGNHPDGKTIGASHALINAFIKDHAEKDLLLDFEGSDVPSLAFFYSSFGAREEKYPGLKVNRLPWWVKWMKR